MQQLTGGDGAQADVRALLLALQRRIRPNAGTSSFQSILPLYERLLSHRHTIQDPEAHLHSELLRIRGMVQSHPDLFDIVDTMDTLVDQCLELSHQDNDPVDMTSALRLLTALAGGADGRTFVLEDPTCVAQELGGRKTKPQRRIGERIRMDSIGLLLHSKSLFHAECIPLGQQDVLAQHDFTAFGALPALKHRDLWVPEHPSGNFFMPMMNSDPWIGETHGFNATAMDDSQPDLFARVMQKENDRKHRPVEASGTMFTHSFSLPSQPFAQTEKKEVFFFDATKEFRCDSSDDMDDDEWRDEMSGQTLSSSGDFDSNDHDPWSKRHRQWEDIGSNSRSMQSIKEITPALSSQQPLFSGSASLTCNSESGVEVCECDVIEDLLHVLCGVESVLFRRDIETASFKLPERRKLKLKNGTIASLASVLAVFERAGSRFMRLEYLAVYFSQDSKRGGKTLQAMGNALLLYLKAYQMHIQQIANSVESSQDLTTITRLLAKTRPLCDQLKLIAQLFGCNQDTFWSILTKPDAFPRGLALLNHLHAHLQAFSAEDVVANVSELTAWFLVKSSEPFLVAMSEFISRGRVGEDTDPFNEFELSSWSRNLMEKAGCTGGDNLFSSRLSVDSESVSRLLPDFLQQTAERIIYMGQLQGLLLSIDSESRKYPALDAHEPLYLYLELDKAIEQLERRKDFMQRKRFRMDEERAQSANATAAAALVAQQANVDRVKLLCLEEEKSALYERSRIDGKRKQQAEQRKHLDDQIADNALLQDLEIQAADEIRRKEERHVMEHEEQLQNARDELLTRYSELMVDADERHQYMTWRRNRALRFATAKQQIQQLYTSEVVTWNREIEDPARQVSRDDCTSSSANIDFERMDESIGSEPPSSKVQDSEHDFPAAGTVRRSSKDGSGEWRPSVKVNREAGARSSIVLGWSPPLQASAKHRSQLNPDIHDIMDSFNENQTTRVLREPGGGGQDVYACLYGNIENESATPSRIGDQAEDIICDGSSASCMDHDASDIDTGDIDMSNGLDSTSNAESTDVDMKEGAQEKTVEDMILAPASPISVDATYKFESIVGLPAVAHDFFSPIVVEEDRELLSRVVSSIPRRVLDLTPFKMIVKRCLDMPIELTGTNLDQVALEVFREKLYVLDHLHRLHKIMLMSEGLCLDMFARDLLAGLHSTTRINWGFDGRLTSALSLAMVEAKVPENRASTHFSYRVSPDLADVLGSWNLAPAISEVLSRIELSYDAQWPLGVVITSNLLHAYAQIHRFLLYCRLTSLELNEIWVILRTIDRRADLAVDSRMQCHDMFTKTHSFLTAFNETFSADVLTVKWNELHATMVKCSSIMELRAAHERFVAVSEKCCFLDAPAKEIYSAVIHLYSVTWKFSGIVRKLEHRAIDNESARGVLERIWKEHNDALHAVVSELQASSDRDQDARRFSEHLLLRFNFNNYYPGIGS